ncbi:MAG: aspartyl protease family protein [Candidatus Latescibacterota bacterium]
MALTQIELEVANPADPSTRATVQLLVDSGATLSVVSAARLRRLRIKPHSKRSFILANGEKIERQIGNAEFFYQGQRGASPVIFGKPGDSDLLGVVTLEALGFMLDPIRRELRPLPMMLA